METIEPLDPRNRTVHTFPSVERAVALLHYLRRQTTGLGGASLPLTKQAAGRLASQEEKYLNRRRV